MKKEIKFRLLHTIPEAMYLLHISDRREFLRRYVDTGRVGLYSEEGRAPMVPRVDIEKVVRENSYYKEVRNAS